MSKTTSIDIGTFTNVGIGDPTPTRALDIRASADTTTGLKDISLIGTNKGEAPMLSLKSYLHASTAEKRKFHLQVVDGNNTAISRAMVLQPDGGNVGVGDYTGSYPDPAFLFETRGHAKIWNKLNVFGNSGNNGDSCVLLSNNYSTGSRNFFIGLERSNTTDAAPNGLSFRVASVAGLDWSQGTTRMHLDQYGRLGLGLGVFNPWLSTPSGHATGPVFGVENDLSASISLFRNDTTIVTGNAIGGIFFYGNGSTSSSSPVPAQELASIECHADENHGDGVHGSGLRFYTNSGTTLTERLKIDKSGNVGINTSGAGERLRVLEHRPTYSVIARFQDEGNDGETVATGDGLVKAVRINSKPSGYSRGDGLNYITYLDLAVDADNAAAGIGIGYGSSGLPGGQTDLSNCEIVLKPGRVGIGTANPTTGRLHVIGGNSADEGIVLGGRKDDGTSLTTLRFFHDDDDNAQIARGADPALTIGANKVTTAHVIKTKYGIITDQTYAAYGSGNSAVASINQHGEGTVFHVVATRHTGTSTPPQLETGYVAFAASGVGVYSPVIDHASISVTFSAVNSTITATNLGGDATIRIAVLQVA